MKKTLIRSLPFLSFALLSICVPFAATAGEIHYGSVTEVKGNTVHITYKGPSGTQNFTCDITSSQCTSLGTTTPELFPALLNRTGYVNSPDGYYAVAELPMVGGQSGAAFRFLYSFKQGQPKMVKQISYQGPVEHMRFTSENDALIVFGTDNSINRFPVESGTTASVPVSTSEQNGFPLRTVSPHGKYVSAYNYVKKAHVIWNLDTRETFTIANETPSYLEFSQDETTAAFVSAKDGYRTLYSISLVGGTPSEPVRLFPGNFVVEDYLFFKGDLYFLANKDSAYAWSLFRYSISAKTTEKVSENVSYGDYIRPVQGSLSFITIRGANSNVSLYDPVTKKIQTLEPVGASASSEKISRTEVTLSGVHGALLKPSQDDGSAKPLFIWMHGGPERQTSLGYHSYLSYAVYDELLEKITESGAYVLKLDYTGSYGYSESFKDGLENNIGSVEIKDVINATDEIKKTLHTSNVYLIGNSYGAYMAVRALSERPDLFAGAVPINGVYDWFTLVTKIPSSPFKNYFGGIPSIAANNLALYTQASAYGKIKNLTDHKVLLVLGEQDSTVPTWQTQDLFTYMKGLNKNVQLLSFPEEEHIIRKRSNLDSLCAAVKQTFGLSKLSCGI